MHLHAKNSQVLQYKKLRSKEKFDDTKGSERTNNALAERKKNIKNQPSTKHYKD
jgi:hypothetical protein